MNPLGIHALVWAADLQADSVRRMLVHTRQAGYDLIELSLHELVGLDLGLTREMLEESHLQVGCSRGLRLDADVSSEDPACVERGIALLREGIDTTAALGGHYFGGILYSAMAKYPGPLSPRGRRNAEDAVLRMAEYAARKEVTIGLEVVNRYETNQLNTARQALDMLDRIQAPNVVVHLDTYHMNIEEVDFMQPVLACGKHLGYVHIGESNRGYLGSGTVDFTQFFKALRAIDYQGVVTFESFSTSVVTPELVSALAIWRNPWTDGMDLAIHAHGFMQAGLHAAGTRVAHG